MKQLSYFFFSHLLAMLTMAGIAAAQEQPRMYLGYIGTEQPKTSSVGLDEAGRLQVARLVDPSQLGSLHDLSISELDFYLVSRINVTRVKVWASYSLDAEPFVTHELEGAPVKGWNKIVLSDLPAVDCKPFYIGYTIDTKGAAYPVGVAGVSESDGLWVRKAESWTNRSGDNIGSLMLSAVITGEEMPVNNLTLVNADFPARLKSNMKNTIPFEVRNSGSNPVTGFTLTVDEGVYGKQAFDYEVSLQPNDRANLQVEFIPLSAESESPIVLTLCITGVREGDDSNTDDNASSAEVIVSPFEFVKRVLLEEFTTEKCVNCPRAASMLHETLADPLYSSRVVAVCHHAGYSTDKFTQPCDEDMLVLYGSGGSYAPAMCFDRYSSDGMPGVGNVPMGVSDIKRTCDMFMSLEAEVDMNIFARFDPATSTLHVDIHGGCQRTIPDRPTNITVYMLENDIPTSTQTGASGDYFQQHVIRGYNATWGVPVEWQPDGRFSYSADFAVDGSYDRRNMEIAAAISYHNPDDALDCAVLNSASCRDIDWGVGTSISMEEYTHDYEVETRNVIGVKVPDNSKGLLIKTIKRKGQKPVTYKVLVK